MSVEAGEIRAKAFFSENYLEAAKKAQEFAGPTGRLATVPDIIDARIATLIDAPAWEQYFTANSAEYFGFTKAGKRIIIVAHGVGPLSDPQSVDGIYNSTLKAERSWGGRISREQFWDLESGKYGEVSIVNYGNYSQMYKDPFISPVESWEAGADPLVQARLGPRTDEYIDRHTNEALKWAREEDQRIKRGEVRLSRGVKRTRPIGDRRYDIIKVGDPDNNHYANRREEEPPLAHLLTIGGLQQLGGNSLYTEIYCSESSRVGRVVGIKGPEPISDIDYQPMPFPKELLQPAAV